MQIHTDKNKNYGILLSGGLDSAVLLSVLLESNRDLQIQPFTIPKKDGAIMYADPIIDYFNTAYNASIPHTIHAGNPNEHHSRQNVSAIVEIFQKYNIDYLFIAINKIPVELSQYPGAPNRATHSNDPRILLPFVNLTKDEIVSLMFLNNNTELMKLAHSCTEKQTTRCNVCWQCTERLWAFKQIDKIDEGEI